MRYFINRDIRDIATNRLVSMAIMCHHVITKWEWLIAVFFVDCIHLFCDG